METIGSTSIQGSYMYQTYIKHIGHFILGVNLFNKTTEMNSGGPNEQFGTHERLSLGWGGGGKETGVLVSHLSEYP